MAIEGRAPVRRQTDSPTAANVVETPSAPPTTAAQLIPEVSLLRYRADNVNSNVASLGREIYALNLRERTTTHEKQSVRALLELLARKGVGWSELSKMLGVSTPAIRKWRQGEGGWPANRHALSEIAALIEMLGDQFMVDDPVSWLEIPIAGTRM